MVTKTKAKHTPGPWKVWEGVSYVGGGEDLCIGTGENWLANMDHPGCENRLKHFKSYIGPCKKSSDVDICTIDTEITDEQRANANLIAAAPELLEACKAALPWVAIMTADADGLRKKSAQNAAKDLGKIQAAIAKAEKGQ